MFYLILFIFITQLLSLFLMHILMITYNNVFFDVEAAIVGSVIEIDYVLPNNYTLSQLWTNIIDLCWDTPIEFAPTKENKMILLELSNRYLNLFTDNNMQDVLQKMRENGYHWARFTMNTSISPKPHYTLFENKTNINDTFISFTTLINQLHMNLNLEFAWIGLVTLREVISL